MHARRLEELVVLEAICRAIAGGNRPLDPFERLGAVALGAALGMSPLLATMEVAEVIPASASAWLWIVGIGVGSALIPMTIYAAAAPTIGPARSAVAGAAELPTVFIIGAAFFGESIRVGHGLAAILIVAAVALTPSTRGPHVSPTDEPPEAAVSDRPTFAGAASL